MDKSLTLSSEQVQARLQAELAHWQLADGQLQRDYGTADFRTAMLLANAIGHVAELAWHHPDLTVSWGRVRVQLMSHDAGGITGRDFELAAEIERIANWQPAEGSALSGTPDEERWRYRVPD
jgi:4a-hydroxytetrahydrobiopterin dehydratase